MPNKRYLSGRRLEWARRDYWRKQGFTVLRTAGSRGFWDLVLVQAGGAVFLVQVKRCKSLKVAQRLCKEFEKNPPVKPGAFVQMMECYVPEHGIVGAWVESVGL